MHTCLCERTQIVLAELLNNIVEHAYHSTATGEITLRVALCDAGLHVSIRDTGLPMPNLRLPEGHLPPIDGPLSTMPEGGFGWYLLRRLAQDLSYTRRKGTNTTCFTLPKTIAEER